MIIDIPGSPGELIDKIVILELKARHFTDPSKRATVERQLASLSALWRAKVTVTAEMDAAIATLRAVNAALWDIEEQLRAFERAGDFGARFVECARAVYLNNDRRAAAKRSIDTALGAVMIEEKSYVTGAKKPGSGQ